jgi:nucleoside 2-deoxyribosyltransferase
MPSIYLAGKVHENCWRHNVVTGLRGAWTDEEGPEEWPVLRNAVFGKVDYCGPYFVSCDHGYKCHERDEFRRSQVFCRCLKAIRACDIFFAWIDGLTAYGTLCEIGYASALQKQIIIGYRSDGTLEHDTWFAMFMAERQYWCKTPEEAVKEAITDLGLLGLDYHEYIRSPEWKAKADEAKRRAGGRCQICNNPGWLHAHHRTYERLGNELPEDITVLCRGRHARFHNKLPSPPGKEAVSA